MQTKISKNSKKLMTLCSVAYFTSYLTRINFAAVIVAIVGEGLITKTLAGGVTTIGFITYGVGQLLSGWLGDRISPKKLMFAGFLTTAAMNMLIPLCRDGYQMCFVWGINGFAQSLMWPPMVKIMKTVMTDDEYNNGCVVASAGSTVATIAIYLLSPLLINQFSWKAIFFLNGFIAVIMSAVWITAMGIIEKKCNVTYAVASKEKSQKKQNVLSALSVGTAFFITVLVANICQGCLRDGITTWIPTYVSEVFHLDSSTSILTGVIIPIFGLASYQVATFIYNKTGKNPYKTTALLFSIALICTAIIKFFPSNSAIFTVIISAISVATMHGVNLVLICFLPAVLAKDNNISTISGLMNFTTYIGSAMSTYGFAVISDKLGWNSTVSSWVLICSVGMVLCSICYINSKNNAEKY